MLRYEFTFTELSLPVVLVMILLKVYHNKINLDFFFNLCIYNFFKSGRLNHFLNT